MADDFDTQHKVEAYKSMINISIEAFKYLALLDGGGVITLLNFVLNSKKSVSGLPIILPTALFAAGLLLCGISMMSAYGMAMKVMAINSWIGWPKKVSIYSGSITAHQLSEPISTSIYRPSGGRPLVNLSNAGRSSSQTTRS